MRLRFGVGWTEGPFFAGLFTGSRRDEIEFDRPGGPYEVKVRALITGACVTLAIAAVAVVGFVAFLIVFL
jgi:hypothetical protein